MHFIASRLLVALSLFALVGCDLKKEVVGETLPGDEIDDTATTEPATDSGATTDDPTTGAPDGAPCDLGEPKFYEEGSMPEPGTGIEYGGGPIVSFGPACAGGVCLFGAYVDSPNCEDDAPCGGDDRLLGTCGEVLCTVDPAWGEAHTTCTRTCEVDTDCPAVPGCDAGPVCTAIAKLGPLCCQKVCGCRDELGEAYLDRIKDDCESGMYCQ